VLYGRINSLTSKRRHSNGGVPRGAMCYAKKGKKILAFHDDTPPTQRDLTVGPGEYPRLVKSEVGGVDRGIIATFQKAT
jgi:hypothetical protein